jgi:thiopeptide-type bacteriocin biosynthesis protein|tara:strand:- start:3324 stop:4187 length:864 start_codon:yes stop_codon:yes gene_type:complete
MKRTFILGEKWLFYKIYCGRQSADKVLLDIIAPFTKECLSNQLITEWFFIRYCDPEPHLRLRFKLNKKSDLGKLVIIFLKWVSPLYKKGIIWNICTDTYVRELERYGTKTMKASERLFCNNSELGVELLRNIKDEKLYFLTVLKCTNSFLSQFQLTETEKIEFYTLIASAFASEFDIQKLTRLSIDKKYRSVRNQFEEIMNNEKFKNLYPAIDKIIFENTILNKEAIKYIKAKKEHNILDVDFLDFLSSHVHMFFNRAFRDKQRFHEMLGYEFLRRHSLSLKKRIVI